MSDISNLQSAQGTAFIVQTSATGNGQGQNNDNHGNGNQTDYNGNGNTDNNGNIGNNGGGNKAKDDDAVVIDDTKKYNFLSATQDVQYFAEPNEAVVIKVNLYNPSSFVILRFTLRTVYQSYQFEAGSTSEVLYLKVTLPSTRESAQLQTQGIYMPAVWSAQILRS